MTMTELKRCKCMGERSEKNRDVGWRKEGEKEPWEPRRRASLLWGGSVEKLPRASFGSVSPALREASLDSVGPWTLTSLGGPHPAPTGSLPLETAGPESSRWG